MSPPVDSMNRDTMRDLWYPALSSIIANLGYVCRSSFRNSMNVVSISLFEVNHICAKYLA